MERGETRNPHNHQVTDIHLQNLPFFQLRAVHFGTICGLSMFISGMAPLPGFPNLKNVDNHPSGPVVMIHDCILGGWPYPMFICLFHSFPGFFMHPKIQCVAVEKCSRSLTWMGSVCHQYHWRRAATTPPLHLGLLVSGSKDLYTPPCHWNVPWFFLDFEGFFKTWWNSANIHM